ncbi:hypothetical protein RchiOBHm_Chr1g0341431 [Rosa chinensis]|uniref:Uncharacterized protein n=1 Tax=Rosa chinensis TaxID=74649 RepID=A0A2P6SDQ8_ROSCH|nr:hypothetical protein RchiOBHm_Chr1g0341431 [Rosa chinensis]
MCVAWELEKYEFQKKRFRQWYDFLGFWVKVDWEELMARDSKIGLISCLGCCGFCPSSGRVAWAVL